MNTESENLSVLLFDGVCNLCNHTTQWIINHDPQGIIHFAPIQSNFAKNKMKDLGINGDSMNSVILLSGEKYFLKSDVLIEVLNRIEPKSFILKLLKLFPKALRDLGYSIIAQNRYLIFGKMNKCMVPNQEILNRFIS